MLKQIQHVIPRNDSGRNDFIEASHDDSSVVYVVVNRERGNVRIRQGYYSYYV